jgi:hypothetical protein
VIYRMAMDVGAALTARKFPLRVEYGPEQTARVAPHSAIVIDRDRTANETIGAAPGAQRNPQKVFARFMPCRALVYACSTVEGARVNEHEHECDRFVDGLMTALYDWAKLESTIINVTGARFATSADGVTPETWAGVVYLVTFTVARGVERRTYTGAGQPEGAPAGAGMRGEVRLRRDGAEPPEIVEIG